MSMEIFDAVSLAVGRCIVGLWVLVLLIFIPVWIRGLVLKWGRG